LNSPLWFEIGIFTRHNQNVRAFQRRSDAPTRLP
jgi:hypothetical protein